MQTIVRECPALLALQRDLEETNFQSATNMPVYTAAAMLPSSSATGADCNANGTTGGGGGNGKASATSVTAGGVVDSSPSTSSSNSSPGRILRIDSTA